MAFYFDFFIVLGAGIEPARLLRAQDFKSCVSTSSTIWAGVNLLFKRFPVEKTFRAKDEIRTRDPDLGKVVLYQLSYFRIGFIKHHPMYSLE